MRKLIFVPTNVEEKSVEDQLKLCTNREYDASPIDYLYLYFSTSHTLSFVRIIGCAR